MFITQRDIKMSNRQLVACLLKTVAIRLIGVLVETQKRCLDSEVLRRTGADFSNATVAVCPSCRVALKRLRQDVAIAWAQSVFIHLQHAMADPADPLPSNAVVQVVTPQDRHKACGCLGGRLVE